MRNCFQIKTADAPCDPMEMGEGGTQTDFAAQKGDREGDGVRISEEVRNTFPSIVP